MPDSHTVTLCGQPLRGPKHICAFFDSSDEQYEALNPYFKEGLEQGEEVITIMEEAVHPEHRTRLERAGIPVRERVADGQLKILSSSETYTRDGVFVADRMFDMLEQALFNAEQGPFGRVRTCGDMEWALLNLPGTEELMEYEARVNFLTTKYDCTLLCVYDLNRFNGRAIADVLATHSHVILNDRVQQNAHYLEPLVYLKRLQRRRSQPITKNASMA